MGHLLSFIIKIPIKIYKLIISPFLPKSCIYEPTCSTYFIRSLDIHGPVKGSVYGLLRILRCNPFFMGGWDKVEKETTLKKELDKFRIFKRR